MSSTLIEELEQAEDDAISNAEHQIFDGGTEATINLHWKQARRLRARIEHLKYWQKRLNEFKENPNLPQDNLIGLFTVCLFDTLNSSKINGITN